MLDFLLFTTTIILLILLTINGIYLHIKTLGSSLYFHVSLFAYCAVLIVITNLINSFNLIANYDINLISFILKLVFVFIIFKIFQIKFNQLDNFRNKFLVMFILFLALIIKLIVKNEYIVNQTLMFVSQNNLILLFILLLCSFLYFSNNKQMRTLQLQYIYIVIFSLFLLEVTFVLNVLEFNYYNLIFSGLNLIFVRLFYYDYRNSFYY